MDPNKSIDISISQILNWNDDQTIFKLVFLAQNAKSLILEKQCTGKKYGNTLQLDCYLNIQYTAQQSIILLRMLTQNQKDEDQQIATLNIDLALLQETQRQYLTFHRGQKVLVVELYHRKQPHLQHFFKFQKQKKESRIKESPPNPPRLSFQSPERVSHNKSITPKHKHSPISFQLHGQERITVSMEESQDYGEKSNIHELLHGWIDDSQLDSTSSRISRNKLMLKNLKLVPYHNDTPKRSSKRWSKGSKV